MKACDAFNFPKEIFIDRFLYSNKKNLKDMLENSKNMKSKLKRIEAEISRIQEFGKNKADLLAALQISADFIDEQAEEMEQDFVEINSDVSDDGIKCDASLPELKRTSDILKQFQEGLNKRLEDLEKRKQTIKVHILYLEFFLKCYHVRIKWKVVSKISKNQDINFTVWSFMKAESVKQSYCYRRCIYNSPIDGGHYYSLIYNQKKNKWMKFNDSNVEEITEEEVMKLATGGNEAQNTPSNKPKPKYPCAYSLFYVESNCEVFDFTPESFEKIKQTLSKELLSFVIISFDNQSSNLSRLKLRIRDS